MKIILTRDVPNLGQAGDARDVTAGYARNYLIPKGLAAKVTPASLQRVEALKKKLRQEELERMGMLRELAARLDSLSLTIHSKASEEGHLFGSVTANMIHAALAAEGVEIDPRTIRLEEHIKNVGVYTVPIHFHPEIQAKLRVWVVEERAEGEAQPGGPVEDSGEDGEGTDRSDETPEA